MRRHFASAFLVALAAACSGTLPTGTNASGLPSSSDPESAAADGANAPLSDPHASSDLLLRDAQLIRLADGRSIASARASELRYRREGGQFAGDQIHATLFPGPQARALDSFGVVEVHAPLVTGETGRKITRGLGGVIATAARGDKASGESVVWHGRTKLLESDQPVSIEGPGYTMAGGAFAATADGSRFELSHGAQAELIQKPRAP
jgi:hypothetical protein